MTIWQALRQFFGDAFSRVKKFCIEHPVLVTVGIIVFVIILAAIVVFLIYCPHSPFKKGRGEKSNSIPKPPSSKPEGDKNVTVMPAFEFKITTFGLPSKALDDINATATTINSLLGNLQALNFTSKVFAVKQESGMRISVQLYCLWLCIAETTQLQCFYGRTNKTCEEGEVCFIRYEESFQSVFKKGCTKKEKYDLTLNKENTFFCSEDWCNDPSKYTDMTGELAQSGQLKCYSLTDGTVGDLITCPSGDEYCFVKMSFDSDITPTKIIGRFCGKNVGVGDYTLKKCQTNGCNNVALRSCYYGVAKTCDSSFEEYLSLAQFNGVQIKNCPHIFYPNVCVTRKLISSDNKTCVVHDCHHLEADHLLYFKRNPTAEELVMKDGNITMTITQCPKENCNEPSQRFKGIRCWVGDQGNCTKPLKFEQKNCPHVFVPMQLQARKIFVPIMQDY
uniref:Uncharacterized protein n=1 Tax=Panagrolaimus sp. JU765 TaxID=591449 RepID=A0AC34RG34_9BILA